MISKEKKAQIIKEISEKLSRQKAVVFFNYAGLKVDQISNLRCCLREEGMDCMVAKKTLIDLALEEAGLEKMDIKGLPGQIALIFGYEDEITPARTLYNFSKNNKQVEITLGIIDGERLEQPAVINLAKLPSREELLAKLVYSVSYPMRGLANALSGNLNKLLFILKGLESKA